jgi:hypothetical protein
MASVYCRLRLIFDSARSDDGCSQRKGRFAVGLFFSVGADRVESGICGLLDLAR